jgi:hypothetical protein
VVVKKPTRTDTGLAEQVCAICGFAEQRIMDPIPVVPGDFNGDGQIDTTDAKLIMQYDLGLLDADELSLMASDVNSDGVVDTTDAKLVMQFDIGLITEFLQEN